MKSRRAREVADGQHLAAVALGPGDPRRQGRGHELVGLARAEVVERPHPQHGEAPAQPGLEAEVVGGDLGRRVGAGRAERASPR